MKIRLLSDLHLEGCDWAYEPADEEIVVLAGDIASQHKLGRERFHRLVDSIKVPVVFVPGNHEYYGRIETIRETRIWMLAQERRHPHLHVLDNFTREDDPEEEERHGVFYFKGYFFVGCSLWSDFSCLEDAKMGGLQMTRDLAMHIAERGIADFQQHLIGRHPMHFITPAGMSENHRQDKLWLGERLSAMEGLSAIVVTHFLPSPLSIYKAFKGSPLNPYFVTDCSSLINRPVRLWLHGHTHNNCDYVHGRTRVVCNPRGYIRPTGGENPEFNPTLVLEV